MKQFRNELVCGQTEDKTQTKDVNSSFLLFSVRQSACVPSTYSLQSPNDLHGWNGEDRSPQGAWL